MLPGKPCVHNYFDFPLGTEEIFSRLSPSQLTTFKSIARSRHFAVESDIFVPDQAPDSIFILLDGRAVLNSGSGCRDHFDISPGRGGVIFGMIEALSGQVFDSKLSAASECEVDIISVVDIFDFFIKHPEACLATARVVGSRYSKAIRAGRSANEPQ